MNTLDSSLTLETAGTDLNLLPHRACRVFGLLRTPSVLLIVGWAPRYRHIVEVDENDPALIEDTSVQDLENEWDALFGRDPATARNPRRFFFKGSLDVIAVEDISRTNSRS